MKAVIVLTASLVAGCAGLPAGEDPKGVELKAEATPVLMALRKYRAERGEFPSSLYELVPRYLKAVPFGPNLQLDAAENKLGFIYPLPWPQTGQVLCVATLGETQWSCQ